MVSHQPNKHFYYFMSITSWLMSILGQECKPPSQMDDPNCAAAWLFLQLKQLGAPINFPSQKLKLGYGEPCCTVLKWLLDQILIDFKPMIYRAKSDEESSSVNRNPEIGAERGTSKIMMANQSCEADIEEEECSLSCGGATGMSRSEKLACTILEAHVASKAWRIELEQVLPQLSLQGVSNPREWRNRLINTKRSRWMLDALVQGTQATLVRLLEKLGHVLQTMHHVEHQLSACCQAEMAEYAAKENEFRDRREAHHMRSGVISALTNKLSLLGEKLQKVKELVGMRGNSMTDTCESCMRRPCTKRCPSTLPLSPP